MENIIKIINKKNLLHNIKHLTKNNKKICAVVKANAYGHGIENIVPIIDDFVYCYAVNTILEAKKVKKFSKKPVIVLCGFDENDIMFASNSNTHLAVFCKKQLTKLQNFVKKHNKNVNIHLKFNTGMNRLGFCEEDIPHIKKTLNAFPNIKLCGIFSHFGGGSKTRDESQITRFKNIIKNFDENTLVHIKSSSYSAYPKIAPNEMQRCGISIYGYEDKNLKPILSIKAKILFCGEAKKGEFVGYGTTFKAQNNLSYAVLQIGYFDGLPRNYVGGYVLIKKKLARILCVCMNMTIVDTTNINLKNAKEAVILNEKLNANTIAKKTNTICYEILTNFS